MKHLVLLGGGRGHLDVLRDMAASPLPSTQVTLVAPHGRHVHAALLSGWVAGHHGLGDIVVPLSALARRAGVRLVDAAVTALDASTRTLSLDNGETLHYDALSIDADAASDRDAIEGAREHALFLRPFEHFIQLWVSMLELAAQRILSVVVIGGGTAGVEMALAVTHRLGARVRVALLTGGGELLPTHSAGVQARARRALRRCNVTVFDDHCVAIRQGRLQLGRGMRLACDAPLMALDPVAPAWLTDSGLARGAAGLLATNDQLQSTSHPEVFAVGPLARAAEGFALFDEALASGRDEPVLAANLRRGLATGALLQRGPPKPVIRYLMLGNRQAIASWGEWAVQGRWVWEWKTRQERAFVQRQLEGRPRSTASGPA
jgi:NADH dehydrogenase FAD-containing subunit